eukprot:5779389-Pyramimonas_sp.AAC.2
MSSIASKCVSLVLLLGVSLPISSAVNTEGVLVGWQGEQFRDPTEDHRRVRVTSFSVVGFQRSLGVVHVRLVSMEDLHYSHLDDRSTRIGISFAVLQVWPRLVAREQELHFAQ